MRLVVATRSLDKLREIRRILEDAELEVVDLAQAKIDPAPEEEGLECHDTFAANALAKAHYFAGRAGGLVLADDSGLCVDALGGGPGVRSKRFSGRGDLAGEPLDAANNQLLLHRLRDVPDHLRTAHYVCAAALVDPLTGLQGVREGRCDGAILRHPRGTGGFGYDPLFLVDGEGATFGEIDPERKNRISHRALAVRAAAALLSSRPIP